MRHHQVLLPKLPGGAQGRAAACRVEQCGIDAAGHHADVAVARALQFDAELARWHQGHPAAVVQSPQVRGDDAFQPGKAVVPAVGVEVGVEFRHHGDVEIARRRDGRGAERPFGRDLHHVGRVLAPHAAQQARRRQAELEAGVAGNLQAAYPRRRQPGRGIRKAIDIGGMLARANQADAMAAREQALHHAAQRHGDAIHLGRKSFRDDRDMQWRHHWTTLPPAPSPSEGVTMVRRCAAPFDDWRSFGRPCGTLTAAAPEPRRPER
jgi:hypothetical protein